MRCGRHPLAECHATREHDAGAAVQHYQVVSGMTVHPQQFEGVPAHGALARHQRLARRRWFGAAHPVAAHAVEVVGIGRTLALRTGDGAGQGAGTHVRIGLIAEEVIRMQVEIEDQPHRRCRD